MKKLLIPFFGFLFLFSCEKESTIDLSPEREAYEDGSSNSRAQGTKINVCHYDQDNDTWHVIRINENAWSAHEGHGDVQLIDEDGDGFVASANECNIPIDCDDSDPQITDDCCIDETEIDSDGPLFVAPNDEPGLYTWQEAIDACAAKNLGGHDWYLPSVEEVLAMHDAKDEIGCFTSGVYSTTDELENNDEKIKMVHFNTEYEGFVAEVTKGTPIFCRCVRR